MRNDLIGLDFETYGAVNLPKHGLFQYTEHETFTPLLGAVAFPDTTGSQATSYTMRYDFVSDKRASRNDLKNAIGSRMICAHNAIFEYAVLDSINLCYSPERFIDSAVVARAAGAGAHLEAAAPQLLNVPKLDAGKHLMRLFSIPKDGQWEFDPQVVADNPFDWIKYGEYCETDADLALRIVMNFLDWLTPQELDFAAITMEMNLVGWPVDIDIVEEMQRRYLENQEVALAEFTKMYGEVNLNSLKQMKEFCQARGIKATSFDEAHVAKLLARIEDKLATATLTPGVIQNYTDVIDLLHTKQVLGGSSLKKLQVALDTAAPVNGGSAFRMKDQYVHCGAGQSLRTTGRSLQLQNLKRLTEPAVMEELLEDPDVEWDNTKLAVNLRQIFAASEKNGFLIVGDFKSVENQGLAWVAGETWKADAFRQGLDLYKVAASRQFGIEYAAVTKDQRQFGKVGELSCGYQAGGGAVQDFAAKMGVTMTEGEAAKLVYDWRDANPRIVHLWEQLDEMLHKIVEHGSTYQRLMLPDGLLLSMQKVLTPASLLAQHPGADSVMLSVAHNDGSFLMKRVFHGCYIRGRNVCFYKPSDRKTGDLWKNSYINPKTKQRTFYQIYGGKLAGILTQSLCREIFFNVLVDVRKWCKGTVGHVSLIGQFHDEIVLDWKPGSVTLEHTEDILRASMSNPGRLTTFPLGADVKHDYRYTK